MYVTLHQKSHQTLEEYGKLVPPAKQVQDLIDRIDCSNRMIVAALATLLATNNMHEDFQAASGYLCNFVAANKSKIKLETSQELGVEVRVVLGEVTVVAGVVARAMDADEVAKTPITRRHCPPGVIQQKNGDSSHMSRKNL